MRALIGTRKGLFILSNASGKWEIDSHHMSGAPVPFAIYDHRTSTIWASLDHGHWGTKLSRSNDGGASWQEVTPPKYPDGEIIKEGVPATARYLWVIQPGADNQPGRIYIGTEPGGLFVSDDDGANWALNRPLWDHPTRLTQWNGGGRDYAGIHSVVIDPRDPNRIFVAVSCAGTWETTDGGATWLPRNEGLTSFFLPDQTASVGHDPHYLAQCASDPEVLWQQNHCGIYVSRDAGLNWTEVSEKSGPARFGFVVSVDPQDGNTAWVVPAAEDDNRIAVGSALCVSRTTDGGKSWTALRDGLPQQAFDIVFRHAMDFRDDNLVFGTTTGNLYASSNRGDTWSEISHNFPPIYSVRFF